MNKISRKTRTHRILLQSRSLMNRPYFVLECLTMVLRMDLLPPSHGPIFIVTKYHTYPFMLLIIPSSRPTVPGRRTMRPSVFISLILNLFLEEANRIFNWRNAIRTWPQSLTQRLWLRHFLICLRSQIRKSTKLIQNPAHLLDCEGQLWK